MVVEPDAFGLLPKLRGAAQHRLRQLLRHWGSAGRAEALLGSWSAVRRCRGLYRVGVLADPASTPLVAARLEDRDFAVRRVAVQALGSIGDPSVIPAMVDLAAREPALRRDLLAAVDRIGVASGPVLEAELVAEELEGRMSPQQQQGQIARALLNVVGNAVEFSHDGARVEVRTRREGAEVVVEVRDEGIGIPAAELDRLGNRFFRASNAIEGSVPGTGLGLRIVQTIVDNHGGRLRVDSVEGQGSTVTVRLPGQTVGESGGMP